MHCWPGQQNVSRNIYHTDNHVFFLRTLPRLGSDFVTIESSASFRVHVSAGFHTASLLLFQRFLSTFLCHFFKVLGIVYLTVPFCASFFWNVFYSLQWHAFHQTTWSVFMVLSRYCEPPSIAWPISHSLKISQIFEEMNDKLFMNLENLVWNNALSFKCFANGFGSVLRRMFC